MSCESSWSEAGETYRMREDDTIARRYQMPSTRARPNILFVIVHDLGTRLGCYGEPSVQTPAVDVLAAEGVRFVNHFCTAPFCSPSRGSIFTGKHPNVAVTAIAREIVALKWTITQQVQLPSSAHAILESCASSTLRFQGSESGAVAVSGVTFIVVTKAILISIGYRGKSMLAVGHIVPCAHHRSL